MRWPSALFSGFDLSTVLTYSRAAKRMRSRSSRVSGTVFRKAVFGFLGLISATGISSGASRTADTVGSFRSDTGGIIARRVNTAPGRYSFIIIGVYPRCNPFLQKKGEHSRPAAPALLEPTS